MEQPRQRTFAVILGDSNGADRVRSTVIANDWQAAQAEAEALAKRLGLDLELVAPAENLPFTPITLPAEEETAADEEPGPGSDRGE